jgi:hypothetical protein
VEISQKLTTFVKDLMEPRTSKKHAFIGIQRLLVVVMLLATILTPSLMIDDVSAQSMGLLRYNDPTGLFEIGFLPDAQPSVAPDGATTFYSQSEDLLVTIGAHQGSGGNPGQQIEKYISGLSQALGVPMNAMDIAWGQNDALVNAVHTDQNTGELLHSTTHVFSDGRILYFAGFMTPEQLWQSNQPLVMSILKTVAFNSPSSSGGGITNEQFQSYMNARYGDGSSQGGFIGPVTPCHSQSMEPRCR